MALLADRIPSIDIAPADPSPSEVGHLIRKSATRRTVLKGIMGTGMVVGMSALSLLPGGRKAYAAYSTWGHCRDYPSSWIGCAGYDPGYLGSRFCETSGTNKGYHLSRTGPACDVTEYTVRLTSCNGRNAWVWRRGQTGGSTADHRCSDGWTHWDPCSGTRVSHKSVCKVSL
jgi:hypothetical protein